MLVLLFHGIRHAIDFIFSSYQPFVTVANDFMSQIGNRAFLLKSCSNEVKVNFLRRSTALLYTPSNEHFGIVPLESMFLECPVVAVNSGGPLETVVDGETGFLCDPEPSEFAKSMKR